jgi:hypothetical protein
MPARIFVIYAYVHICGVQYEDAAKFDCHFESMILNWYKEYRHHDFDNVANLYPARCDAVQPIIRQSIEYVIDSSELAYSVESVLLDWYRATLSSL